MSIATETVPLFQAHWADRFTDTCTIIRTTGQTLNTTTGAYSAGTPTTVYSGACLVRPQAASSAQFGGEQVELRGYNVFVPYTVEGVLPDDVVTVTSTTDGELDGKTLIVHNVQSDTYNTRRLLECENNQGA